MPSTNTRTGAATSARPVKRTVSTKGETAAQISKREQRARHREQERRRRNQTIGGILAVLAVIGIAWFTFTHLPSGNKSASTAGATASNCPVPTATAIGPQPASPNAGPAAKPPALPAKAKTQSESVSYTAADGTDKTTTLQYVVITQGCGAAVKSGDTVSVNYTGWLQSTGKMFDSSLQAGRPPFSVHVGQGQVIKGWDAGLVGMKPGETRRLIIPGEIAYGATGSGSTIPPNATLVFDVTLLSIGQ